MSSHRRRYAVMLLPVFALLAAVLFLQASARATPTPPPTSVTIAGSMQSEVGCPGDWQPDCAASHLAYDANDDVWQGSWAIPAGAYEYKAALNNSWTENYGLHGIPGGPNIPLPLTATTTVKFYYDHKSHWVTDNQTTVIAVAPGDFQQALGCSGNWDPGCLRSWLQDLDGDGVYTFTTTLLPAGNYQAKVAINESWTENYGAGCAPNGSNIGFSVPNNNAAIEFRYVAATHCLTIGGAQRGSLGLAQAHWVSRDTIAWRPDGAAANTYKLFYDPNAGLQLQPTGIVGGQSINLTYDPAGLPFAVLNKFPYLTGFAAFKIAPADLDKVPAILKSQVAVQAVDPNNNLVDATELQIPGVLDDLYTYNGPLGVTYQGANPTLRLWAPTAQNVQLRLYADSNPATAGTVVPMTYDAATGVWTATGAPGWNNQYYLYEVQVFTRATNHVEHNLVTDPYSLSLSTNSARSQIVNLADASLKPPGWDGLRKPPLAAPEDIVVYELHLRDFSANDSTVPAAHRGTYLAFTDSNSNGMQHLRALANAGLTHVHLLPVFDFATVNEDKATWQQPDPAELSTYPPDSEIQQQKVNATKDVDAFNWGYDPYHYTVPEGSYATNPDGTTRIREFRSMVKGLSDNGLRVVMDVVYNHTTASGEDPKSVLDKVVPGYYHRLNLDGNVETSTCCQNTASEHNMMEKLMVDSVVTWAKEYKVDGFRFDLMGHHMVSNMVKIRDALHALTPGRDGVDGSKIYIYGEGWNFGEVANNARGVNATQLNLPGTGIGTFNDRIRDGVRGGGPFSGLQEQGFIDGLYYDPNGTDQGDQLAKLLKYEDWIRVGLAGNLRDYQFVDRTGATVTGAQVDYNGAPAGYTLDPQEDINYAEAHDNQTLFDAITMKAPVSDTMQDRVRMQDMGMDVIALGEGVPFFHAGVDMMRSKSLDGNSYNSGDWFNKLDFSFMTNNFGVGLPLQQDNGANWPLMRPLLANPALKPAQPDILQSVDHFQEMLRIRKSSPLFRLQTGADIMSRVKFLNTGPAQIPGLIVMSISDTTGANLDPRYDGIVVLFNAGDQARTFGDATLTGTWSLHPIQAASSDPVVRTAAYNATQHTFTVPARTTAVFVQQTPCVGGFSDVPADHWAYGYVKWAFCQGVIAGYADGTFRPEANATRGQIAKMTTLAAGYTLNLPAGAPHFRDVDAGNPFYLYIEVAYSKGLVSGYSCGGVGEPCPGLYFRPSSLVTRAQLAKMIVLAAGYSLPHPATPTFADVPADNWAYGYIEAAYAHNVIGGYTCAAGPACREFRPGAEATRAQLSKMLFQAYAVPSRK